MVSVQREHKYMRLLVFTPLYHQYPASLKSILALDKPCAVDYLMLANDDPHTDGTLVGNYRNITAKSNRARDVFLAGDYDALVSIEDDIIVPRDALVRLLDCNSDIAYGLVCWRHGTPPWSARVPDDEQPLGRVLSDRPSLARDLWGKVVDVVGVGMACTMIKRPVLERLAFRLNPGAPMCCDWFLAVDARREGFTQRADLGLVCGHITPDPTPRIIWPSVDEEERLWRIEKLS